MPLAPYPAGSATPYEWESLKLLNSRYQVEPGNEGGGLAWWLFLNRSLVRNWLGTMGELVLASDRCT
ncbi:MAG: hypothetical protein IGS49_11365 [Chlorogloeopsis fritschii C42_A2020_084]|uniref:hypothetical protein n=1 Tax=Chlorogloeopsis fritschii TaxID=1124 RepID=UPI0019E233FE|nr:hypothetical protein [Chlorogloeopsis fritschii]MBF2006034.1 hypothetical protein [Chlorogloeopsis fritschii C42_A2020_084]